MQDIPQPTDQQREEFREMLSEVIATLHDVQPFINQFPAETYNDGSGDYIDPVYQTARQRLNSTLTALEHLRGDMAREWLHAYMERKRANAPRPRYRLLIDGLRDIAEVQDRDGCTLVSLESLAQLNRVSFAFQVEKQCPQQSAYIIQFFQSSGINALQSYRKS